MEGIFSSFDGIFNTILFYALKSISLFCLKIIGLDDDLAKIDDIEILHDSDNFIILNKRYDILINSNDTKDKITIQTQLKHLYPNLANPKLAHEFFFVHRLDYPTSGILCIPKNREVTRQSSKAFELCNVRKFYLAIVRGVMAVNRCEINIGIGPDDREGFKTTRMGLEDSPYVSKFRPSCTRVIVLETGISHGYPATKVLLKPMTGRRHQLRLHLNSIGHTIVGDYVYSNKKDVEPYRMFLHAYRFVLSIKIENIDICTLDPFLESDHRNQWTPWKHYHTYEEAFELATSTKINFPQINKSTSAPWDSCRKECYGWKVPNLIT